MKFKSINWILIALGLVFYLTEPQANALALAKTQDKNSGKVLLVQNKVELWARDRTLGDVLQEVNEKSGIQFILPEALLADSVNTDIHATDWKSATEQLVKEYSRIEIWADDPIDSKVWLLSSDQTHPILTENFPSNEPIYEQKSQLELALFSEEDMGWQDSLLDILPPEILIDPALWAYLQTLGIQIPEEAQELFGPALKNLPSALPIPPHIVNNPELKDYLSSVGVQAAAPSVHLNSGQ